MLIFGLWWSPEEIYIIRLESIDKNPLQIPFIAFGTFIATFVLDLDASALPLDFLAYFEVVLEEDVEEGGEEHIVDHGGVQVVEEGEVDVDGDARPVRQAAVLGREYV